MKEIKWMVLLLLLATIGCDNGERQVKLLQEKTWQLMTMDYEGKVFKVPEKLPDIFFTDSTACSGFSGCNRFFGKYDVDAEGNLTIQLGGATMMHCPEIEFEDLFLKVLSKVERYTITKKVLVLKNKKETLHLRFVLKEVN